jgi:hypothetical protein
VQRVHAWVRSNGREVLSMHTMANLLTQIPALNVALAEQQVAVRDVWRHASEVMRVDESVPERFRVSLDPMPEHVLTLFHNMISAPFLAVLQPLGVAPARRMLYGRLNHLFRTWVTCADNLLDHEDKGTFPLRMPGRAFVMRQVVVLMLADRILHRVLDEAVEGAVITRAEARILSDESLRILLPSAAEEAFEEGGLSEWPEPSYVLEQLHPLKTGILFRIPFLGPEKIEQGMDPVVLKRLRDALQDYGIGCQMIDDVRDLSRDFQQRRANYLISLLAHGRHSQSSLATLADLTRDGDLDRRLDHAFPEEVAWVCERAVARLSRGFNELDALGLKGYAQAADGFIAVLMARMDLAHLIPRFVKLAS